MPDKAQAAAALINARWMECLNLNGMTPTTCPNNDEVAQIIRDQFGEGE